MRLIDADKLHPDRMTNKGTVAISQSQIAKAPTVQAVPIEVLDKIRAEIEKPLHDERCFDTADAKAQYIALSWCIEIIDKYKAESEDKE